MALQVIPQLLKFKRQKKKDQVRRQQLRWIFKQNQKTTKPTQSVGDHSQQHAFLNAWMLLKAGLVVSKETLLDLVNEVVNSSFDVNLLGACHNEDNQESFG